jgi:hypothetical protein
MANTWAFEDAKFLKDSKFSFTKTVFCLQFCTSVIEPKGKNKCCRAVNMEV